ncbi:MAG TPA: uroporphyrinogen-III synthase [Chloroflexota bacterium]|nr:uroporphyrinogen-III synthase [Chloroflexota bacterium]
MRRYTNPMNASLRGPAPGPLAGRVVAFLESRRSAEIARLIEVKGGTALVAPALRESPTADDATIDAWLAALTRGDFAAVVFLTGVGCQLLLDRSQAIGLFGEVLAGLSKAQVVARGPKPLHVLKSHGVRVDLVAPEPNTSEDLLAALATWDLRGKRVGVQLYGGATPYLDRLREGLLAMGASISEAAPYRWEGPSDEAPVVRLIDSCVEGSVDALAIFSSSQIHTLFAIADEHGRSEALRLALNGRMLIASIGPVSSEAIEGHGVRVNVTPPHPKMGHLISAIAEAFAQQPAAPGVRE